MNLLKEVRREVKKLGKKKISSKAALKIQSYAER